MPGNLRYFGNLLKYKEKKWRQKYVELYEDSTLIWYESRDDMNPIDSVNIKNMEEDFVAGKEIEKLEEKPRKCTDEQLKRMFVVPTSNKPKAKLVFFMASDKKTFMNWMRAIISTLVEPPTKSKRPAISPIRNKLNTPLSYGNSPNRYKSILYPQQPSQFNSLAHQNQLNYSLQDLHNNSPLIKAPAMNTNQFNQSPLRPPTPLPNGGGTLMNNPVNGATFPFNGGPINQTQINRHPINFNQGQMNHPINFNQGQMNHPINFNQGQMNHPINFNQGQMNHPINFNQGHLFNQGTSTRLPFSPNPIPLGANALTDQLLQNQLTNQILQGHLTNQLIQGQINSQLFAGHQSLSPLSLLQTNLLGNNTLSNLLNELNGASKLLSNSKTLKELLKKMEDEENAGRKVEGRASSCSGIGSSLFNSSKPTNRNGGNTIVEVGSYSISNNYGGDQNGNAILPIDEHGGGMAARIVWAAEVVYALVTEMLWSVVSEFLWSLVSEKVWINKY